MSSWEMGSILHWANSSQSPLAQGQVLVAGGQWKPCFSMLMSLLKGKHSKASQGKEHILELP